MSFNAFDTVVELQSIIFIFIDAISSLKPNSDINARISMQYNLSSSRMKIPKREKENKA